jgi:protein-S-isoprenylcysteine O-methyltransferase Ste14
MRNPIRAKNLNARFMPVYLVGLVLIVAFPPWPGAFALALPPIVLGLGLRSWGAGHLVKNHALTTSGPYAHLRHPLYAGTLLIASGFALLVGHWASVVVLLLVWPWFALHYFPRKERLESARLIELYGDRFARYRRAVPALWPRWRAWRDEQTGAPPRSWALERYSDNNELGTVLAVGGGLLVFALRGWAAGL